MKKTKTTIALLAAATMVLIGVTSSEARPGWGPDGAGFKKGGKQGRMGRHRGGRGHGKGMRFDADRMKAALGLSDDQVQRIKAIKANVGAQTKSQRDQLKPLRQKMRALMQARTMDAAQIYAVHSQIQSLQQLVNEEQFKAKLQLMQLLTVEQRNKLHQRRLKRKQMFRGKRFGDEGKA